MDRPTFMRKLDEILSAAERDRRWGKIEIDLEYGEVVMLRDMRSTKLKEDKPRGQRSGG